VALVQQLERRPARVEEHDPALRRLPDLELRELQRVPVERERLVEVGHGQREPQFLNRHSSSS